MKNLKFSKIIFILALMSFSISVVISTYAIRNLGRMNTSLESINKETVISIEQLKITSDKVKKIYKQAEI